MTRTKDEHEGQVKYPELHDIPQVTLAEAKEQILLSLKYNQRRGCVVLVGESGLGKTQIFPQIAQETGRKVLPIHTAQYGLMGAGIPLRTEDDFFKIAVPDVFPKHTDKAIIVFDELNQGLKHTLNMFFTLMEDGRIFNYNIPKDCLVAATMNPATANYAVTTIENNAAIRRRVKFFYIIPDFKGFLAHASSPAFHQFSSCDSAKSRPCFPELLNYFKAKPSNIYDIKAKDNNKQYCCPAVIETISEDLYNIDMAGISLHGEFAQNRISASLGCTMAAEIVAHLKDSSITLSAEDVLNNYKKVKKAVKSLVSNNMHEKLTDLCMNVLSLLFASTPDVPSAAINFLTFCGELPQEITLAMLTNMRETAKQNDALPYLNKLMAEFQKHDAWSNLQIAIDNSHIKIAESIKKS